MSPIPPLTGLGIHVRRVDAVRPDGAAVTFLPDDVRLIEHRGVYMVEAPDLPDPIPLDAGQVEAAGMAVVNLAVAVVHEARRARRGDDPVDEALARMLAVGLRLAGAA